MKSVLATLATLATFAATAAETFCNPMPVPDTPVGILCRDSLNGEALPEIPWQNDCWKNAACGLKEVRQFRELADPVVLAEGDMWYLYSSAGLMWTSDDFGGTWRHVGVQAEADYAPAVAKFRGKYYLCTSGGPLSVADSPTGPFRTLGAFDKKSFSSDPQMPHTLDPALFVDGDHLYLYWGCFAKPKAVWCVELDPENPLRAKTPGSAVCLVEFDTERYPWLDRLIEGAWVFKRSGTYYLAFATYGTSDPRYSWCAMKGPGPLGPFVPQKNNPFFMTEKGLVTGTGHGSIWCDKNGDWWINSCVAVCAYHGFERLLAQDRLFFEPDGDIAVGKATETPQWLPSSGRKGDTGWKAIPLKSARPEATDGSLKTWSAVEGLPSKTVFEFPGERTIRSFRVIWRDLGLDTNRGVLPGPYRYRVDYRSNGVWWTWLDASKNDVDLMVDYREALEAKADAVRLVVLSAPPGITPGLVEFTVFGCMFGELGRGSPFPVPLSQFPIKGDQP